MKKTFKLLTFLITILCTVFIFSIVANAETHSGSCGDNVTWSLDTDGGVLVISGSGEMVEYGESLSPWYPYAQSIITVIIEEGITSIGSYSFENLKNLSIVAIFESVEKISKNAFWDCADFAIAGFKDSFAEYYANENGIEFYFFYEEGDEILAEGTCGENVTWSLSNVGVLTISGVGEIADYKSSSDIPWGQHRYDIQSIIIEDGVTRIGQLAFFNIMTLENATIPTSVTSIGDSAFGSCYELNNIIIPESVTTIEYGAFCNCSSLESIVLPDSVIGIQPNAFYETAFYNNSDNWVNGLLYIGNFLIKADENIFGECILKENTKVIADGAFENCAYITSVIIPNGVTLIGNIAFNGCANLVDITIPDSVTGIGAYAFSDCKSLTNISIPDGVTLIAEHTFSGCSNIKNIMIGNGVASIERYAFLDCISLENVVIPDSVTYISERAFSDCVKLESIVFGNGITEIPFAFDGCTNISSITIGSNISRLNGNVFYDSENFKSIYITDLVSWCKIDWEDVFYNPISLYLNGELITELVIPSSVTSIGDYAFYNCFNLTSIKIPSSVTSIGDYAFYNCFNLTSIKIPSSVTSIGDYAFRNCYLIEKVNIENIVAWCNIEFSNASSNPLCCGTGELYLNEELVTDLVLPCGLTHIGDYAFCGCDLTTIIIPDSVTTIGEDAFYGCENLTIYGYTNSTAETYATDNDIPFKALDNTKISGKSLYLDGGIGVKVHFEYDSEVVSPESLVFNVALTNSSDNSVTQKEVPLMLNADTNTAYTIVYVPAKDINTVSISGTLMGETVSGTKAQLDSVSEITVPTYIKELEESAKTDSSYANALDVAHAMETYCSYADAYFNNTEIEDITLTDAEESAISEIAYPSITDKTLGDIEFYSTSLLLEGTVTLRHYFKVTGDIDLTDYVVDGGSELTLSDSSVGYAYIDIENISANELGVQKTVKITNNGETTEIVFSPLNYVKLAYNDDDTALKNLVRALYRYGVKATEYTE